MDSDVAQVRELWDEYAVALDAGDFERWISLWIDDGLQMAPDAPPRIGKEQIRAAMQPSFDLFNWQMAIYPDEIQVLGDQAYSHGLFELVMTPKAEGDTFKGNGKFLTILHRQIDGLWKIAVDCFNYNEPFA